MALVLGSRNYSYLMAFTRPLWLSLSHCVFFPIMGQLFSLGPPLWMVHSKIHSIFDHKDNNIHIKQIKIIMKYVLNVYA